MRRLETEDKKQLQEEFIEWLKSKGKSSYGLHSIYLNDNGTVKTEKRMSTEIQTDSSDWLTFCKEKDYDYGAVKLIVLT